MAKSKPRRRTARPVRNLVAFVDADVAKGGRISRHQLTKGPESWQLERVGIVWARADERCLTPVGDELIDGPLAALDTVAALERADLVVGHGLLQSDLRALAMLTPLPDALLEACVDTLVVLHEARGGQWATGLNLGDLSWHTLRTRRAKHGNGRDDARLHARLWQHLRTRATFTAPARALDPTPVTCTLDAAALDQLRGRQVLGAAEWHRRRLTRGTIHAQGQGDLTAAALAAAADTNFRDDLTPLRACATELLDTASPPHETVLLAAFQLLGPGANLKARQALTAGRFARSVERLTAYTEALWKTVHPDARHRWRTAEPRYDPVLKEMDFSAPHNAQAEQRHVFRQAEAAAERVHQNWRQARNGRPAPNSTTAEL
ncbi:hypothetical protein PV415_36780 [Streptomyces sp. ME03-5684b]|uniref:hypothetical protein n=1 Tax=Streptomyces sp. ME03-5684b TaxID=3028681 RepID=UPI0029B2F805|nr:hypothetical protein [Streptomyces sp. ME03-5684b]MDX3322459.1 hypothetical protein [Streptomyces sp. ME03-5684b]